MTEPTGDDRVLPFQLDALSVRGRVARLDATIDRILTQHAYPAAVSGLLAEAALLTALIGSALRVRGRFSLQARGDGPVRLLAADYVAPEEEGAPARLRAYADFDPANPPKGDDGFRLLGKGHFGVLIDQGAGMTPYQGVTPLVGARLADCAEAYFAQSEQIPTRFALAAALAQAPGEKPEWRAGGVMIQHLPAHGAGAAPKDAPSGGEAPDDPLADAPDDWRTAALKLATVEEHELIGPHVSQEELLLRLFHEDGPRVFTARPVVFGCGCSAEKVEAALEIYSRDEIKDMILPDGSVSADCQFCGARYRFDPETKKAKRS